MQKNLSNLCKFRGLFIYFSYVFYRFGLGVPSVTASCSFYFLFMTLVFLIMFIGFPWLFSSCIDSRLWILTYGSWPSFSPPLCHSLEIMIIFKPVKPKLVCSVICQEFKSNTQLCLGVGVGGGEKSKEQQMNEKEEHCPQSELSQILINVVGIKSQSPS